MATAELVFGELGGGSKETSALYYIHAYNYQYYFYRNGELILTDKRDGNTYTHSDDELSISSKNGLCTVTTNKACKLLYFNSETSCSANSTVLNNYNIENSGDRAILYETL